MLLARMRLYDSYMFFLHPTLPVLNEDTGTVMVIAADVCFK